MPGASARVGSSDTLRTSVPPPPSSLAKQRCDPDDFRFELGLRQFVNTRTDNHHNVDAWRKKRPVAPERLAYQTLGTISLHRLAHLARSNDTQTGHIPVLAWCKQNEQVARRHSSATLLNTQEITTSKQTPLTWQRLSRRVRPVDRTQRHYFLYVVVARRARPLRRRLLMTLRPPLVLIRCLKPCVRTRRVLWG